MTDAEIAALRAEAETLLTLDGATRRYPWTLEPEDGYFPSIRVTPRRGDRPIDHMSGRLTINDGVANGGALEDFRRLAEYVTAAVNSAPGLVRSLLSTLTAQAEALAEARRERDEARAVALEACDLAETMFTNWSGTDGARVGRNLGSDAESEAMDEIERLRTALTAGGKP